MIETKRVRVRKETTVAVICDLCGSRYVKGGDEDDFEIQEFLFIRFTGGYGSVFGDLDQIECDICQRCLKKIIDGRYRVTGQVREIGYPYPPKNNPYP